MKKIFCRILHFCFSRVTRLFKNVQPVIINEPGVLVKAADILKERNVRSVLIVASHNLLKNGQFTKLLDRFDELEIEYSFYTDISSEPTVEDVEYGLEMYKENNCTAIIAVGGGSKIDAAKLIGARAVRPDVPVSRMKGYVKVLKKTPLFIAVPTTAGSGSEVTIAAVVSGTKNGTHYKYVVSDYRIIPDYALLDANLTLSLPDKVTVTTGMDALTHAVEAYTNLFASKFVKEKALESVRLILANLPVVHNNPGNVVARSNMLIASTYAGQAFTNNFVGNVHALAHALGGVYGVSHGLANAVILVPVLKYYGEAVYKPLSEIADYCGIEGRDEKEKALNVIERIDSMRKELDIQDKFDCIKDEDIEEMVNRCYMEAVPMYPCPVIFDKKDFETIYRSIQA